MKYDTADVATVNFAVLSDCFSTFPISQLTYQMCQPLMQDHQHGGVPMANLCKIL